MHNSIKCGSKKPTPQKLKTQASFNLELTGDKNKRKFLIIEVVDTGIGMKEKDIKELFSKFGTGKNSRGLNTNGLGLGLYLSKEILHKLNGDISCESVSGFGSTFRIKLQFDSKYEIKELLINKHETKSQTSSKNPKETETKEEDFEEFKNHDTRDNLKDNIHNYFGMGIRNHKIVGIHSVQRLPSFESKSISLKS